MDGIPTFCIVDERKQFVPLRVQGPTGAVYSWRGKVPPNFPPHGPGWFRALSVISPNVT